MPISKSDWLSLKKKTLTAVLLGAGCALALVYASTLLLIAGITCAGLYTLFYEWYPLTARASISHWLILPILGAWFIMGYLSTYTHGRRLLGLTLLLVALHDSTAQITGLYCGKYPLALATSPRKTVEGAIGGWLATVIAAIVYCTYNHPEKTIVQLFVYASGFCICAISGDLYISYIKRRAGVKDTGTLLPGHGGLLDRVDSLLAVVYYVFFISILSYNT